MLKYNFAGETLVDLLATAGKKVILIAPFIKAEALRRLLNSLGPHVSITCVTRWLPNEIVCGVSDIDVWEILKERSNSRLFLLNSLHTKLYQVDEKFLTGSANITLSALGWTSCPNYEILVEPVDYSSVLRHEEDILRAAFQVTQEYYDIIRNSLTLVGQENSDFVVNVSDLIVDDAGSKALSWRPSLRNPNDLYGVYSCGDKNVSSASYHAARQDLDYIRPPLGLDRDGFITFVRLFLVSTPLWARLDEFFSTPRRFGEVLDFLLVSEVCQTRNEASMLWQTTMRWMMYFFGERYRLAVPNYSEIFVKVGT